MTKRDYFAVWILALVMTLAMLLYVDRAMAETAYPSSKDNAAVVVEVASKLKPGQWVMLNEITPDDVSRAWRKHTDCMPGCWSIFHDMFATRPAMPVEHSIGSLYNVDPVLAGYLEYKHGYFYQTRNRVSIIKDVSVRTNLTLNGTIIIGELRNIRNNSTNAFQIAIPDGATDKIRVVFPRSQTADRADWRDKTKENKTNHILYGIPVGERMPVQLKDKRIYRQYSLRVKDGVILNADECKKAGFDDMPYILQGHLNAYKELGERPDVTAEMQEISLADLYADNPTLVKSMPPFVHHPQPFYAEFCSATIKSIESAMAQQKGDTVVVPSNVDIKKLYKKCGGMVGYWEGNSGITHLSGNTFTRKPIARTANIVTEGKMLVGKTADGKWHMIGIKKDGTVLGGEKKLAVTYDTLVVDGVMMRREESEAGDKRFWDRYSAWTEAAWANNKGTYDDYKDAELKWTMDYAAAQQSTLPLNRGGYSLEAIQGYLYAITGTGKQLDEMMSSGKIIEFVTPTTIYWSDLKSVRK